MKAPLSFGHWGEAESAGDTFASGFVQCPHGLCDHAERCFTCGVAALVQEQRFLTQLELRDWGDCFKEERLDEPMTQEQFLAQQPARWEEATSQCMPSNSPERIWADQLFVDQCGTF